MRFILYQSKQETQNFVEKLPIEQIREMLEFKQVYSEELQAALLKEYWTRINKEIKENTSDD